MNHEWPIDELGRIRPFASFMIMITLFDWAKSNRAHFVGGSGRKRWAAVSRNWSFCCYNRNKKIIVILPLSTLSDELRHLNVVSCLFPWIMYLCPGPLPEVPLCPHACAPFPCNNSIMNFRSPIELFACVFVYATSFYQMSDRDRERKTSNNNQIQWGHIILTVWVTLYCWIIDTVQLESFMFLQNCG